MRLRKLAGALATGACAATMLAAPAAAASNATVFVAHGIPGAVVDVCVNGAEVRSGFHYGQWFKAKLPAGDYRIKVRLDQGHCQGAVVIREEVSLTAALNATAVARLVGATPSLAIFVNDLGIDPAGDASLTVRHVAVAPKVDVWLNGGSAPAIDGIAHGEEVGPVIVPAGVYSFWASREGGVRPIIGPDVAKLRADHAYQVIAVGNSPGSYRFIVIGQRGDPA